MDNLKFTLLSRLAEEISLRNDGFGNFLTGYWTGLLMESLIPANTRSLDYTRFASGYNPNGGYRLFFWRGVVSVRFIVSTEAVVEWRIHKEAELVAKGGIVGLPNKREARRVWRRFQEVADENVQ